MSFEKKDLTLIRNLKTHIGLKSIELDKRINVVSKEIYSNSKNFGLLGLDKENLAILVGLGDSQHSETKTMIIMPKLDGSLYTSLDGKGLFADYLLVYEDKSLGLVKTDAPIPIDLLNISYSNNKEVYENFSDYLINSLDLHILTDDKIKTKNLLQKNGIRVPRGSSSNEDGFDLESVVQSLSGSGIVIKPNHGSRGNGVKMFYNPKEAMDYASDLISKGKETIIEERITPDEWIENGVSCDWNIRYLVWLSKHPKLIDCEIRIDHNNDNPINVSRGSYALDGNELWQRLSDSAIYDLWKEATISPRIIFSYFKKQGKELHGILGLDIMIKDGMPYLLEVNSGAVGGFATLSRIRKEPNRNIEDALLPELEILMKKQYAKRELTTKFKRIKPDIEELSYMSFRLADIDYGSTRSMLLKVLESKPDNEANIRNVGLIMAEHKEYDFAHNLVEKGLKLHPKSDWIHVLHCIIHTNQKDYTELEKAAKDAYKAVPYSLGANMFLHVVYRINKKKQEQLDLENHMIKLATRFFRKDSIFEEQKDVEGICRDSLRAESYSITKEHFKRALMLGCLKWHYIAQCAVKLKINLYEKIRRDLQNLHQI